MVTKTENKTNKSGTAAKRGHTYYQWIFSLLAGSTNLVYGFEYGWISPTAKKLQSEDSPSGYPLSDYEISWVTSCLSIAATLFVIVYSYVSDRHGRKACITFIAFMEVLAWVIRIFNNSYICLIVARVCAGVAAGGCYTVVLVYVKEISQDDIRGILCTFNNLFQCLGIFMMYFLGAYLDYFTVSHIIVCIPIITMLGMIFAPESPEVLIKQGKIDKAIETVAFLRGLEKDDQKVETIVETMTKEAAKGQCLFSMKPCPVKNKVWRRGFILIMFAVTFYEMNGASVVITFASVILTSTEIKFVFSPEILSLSLPVVMLIGSLTLTSCIERYGRKPLLIAAYIVSMFSMTGMVVVIIVQEAVGGVSDWIPVALMVLVVAAFSGGVCPVTFVMLTEMFNFQIRAKLMSLIVIVTYAWAITALLLQVYLPITNALGAYVPFVFFGFINFGGVFFTIFYLTETKGKSDEEILQDLMKRKKLIWK